MPTPGVGDADLHRPVVPVGLDRDLAALGREPDRVVDEVEQHLVDALAVGVDRREIVGHVGSAPRRPRSARATSISEITCVDERRQRHLLAMQRHLARLQPREIEQLLDEAAEPLGSAPASPAASRGSGCSTPSSRFSRWARIAVIGVFSSCETLATRSRRRLLEMLELAAHPVEGGRELPDLIPAVRRARARSSRPAPSGALPAPCRAAAASCRARATGPSPARCTRRDRAREQELPPDALQEAERRRDPARNPARGRRRRRRAP